MKHVTLIFLLLLSLSGRSQENLKPGYSFSLEQAISHALENNYKSINAGRDIDAAKAKKWETTAAGLPQINAGADYTYNLEIQQQPFPSKFFDPNAPEGEFTAIPIAPKQSLTVRGTLSQLIFDGSYLVALQASKTYLKYYQNAKRKNATEVREMVINSYGNVLLAEESIAILEKNKSTLQKTLSDTEETFKNGLIEEENVEQLQITLGSININLANTKRLLDVNYKMLKITLGIDIDADLKLTDKLDSLTVNNLDVVAQDSFSVANNIDYQMAQNLTEQRTLELKLEKSKALPTLSANLNLGSNTFGENFTFFNNTQKWYYYSYVGASLNIPIFSSFGRRAKTQQAKIALEQSRTQLTETEQMLKLQYERAASDYEFSIEQYNTSKSNLSLAERIERKQQTKFTEGLSSSFDFSEAQRQLYTAQQDYLQSMVDIINKKAALEKITNTK